MVSQTGLRLSQGSIKTSKLKKVMSSFTHPHVVSKLYEEILYVW